MDGKLRPKEFRNQVLDQVSPSFCGSKFLSGTIWLATGRTASCHHCPADNIQSNDLATTPSRLFNTDRKKWARELMLKGERPPECSYCWSQEDQGVESDRTYSSGTLSFSSLLALKKINPQAELLPKQLEIAFDRTCNFSCSYCGPQYSTRWKNDIQTHGPIQIDSDTSGQFKGTFNELFKYENDENPFLKAFWQWWPELKTNLDELRVTGGEPLLSADAWRLLEDLSSQPLGGMKLAVNSNLGFAQPIVNRLLDLVSKIPRRVSIYTSCEAYGESAEYIREGLDFNLWQKNVEMLLATGHLHKMVVTMTVGALSMPSLLEFLDSLIAWKNKYGRLALQFSVNELKSPSFQTVRILPLAWRQKYAADIQTWLEMQPEGLLTGHETDGLLGLIGSLKNQNEVFSSQAKDFKKFFTEHDRRREKQLPKSFSSEWVKWMEGINV